VSTPPRPIEAYVHGLSSPVALIEGAEAVALLAYCDLTCMGAAGNGLIDANGVRQAARVNLVGHQSAALTMSMTSSNGSNFTLRSGTGWQ